MNTARQLIESMKLQSNNWGKKALTHHFDALDEFEPSGEYFLKNIHTQNKVCWPKHSLLHVKLTFFSFTSLANHKLLTWSLVQIHTRRYGLPQLFRSAHISSIFPLGICILVNATGFAIGTRRKHTVQHVANSSFIWLSLTSI